MLLPTLTVLIAWEVEVLLVLLAAVIVVKLLTGAISTSRLFFGRVANSHPPKSYYFSPERVQLLAVTLAAALYYLSQVVDQAATGRLPSVPEVWIAILGGSNGLYLGGKAYTMGMFQDTRIDSH